MRANRTQIAIRLGVLSIILNCLLFIGKAGIGWWMQSMSVISDAFHTLSDVLTSLLVILSFRISSKPSDEEHPFGHGRAEPIIAIIMATLLGVTGFELIKESMVRLFNPSEPRFQWVTVLFLALSIVAKEWLARYTHRISDVLESDTLKADAWHHRTDAISTLLVIVAIIGAHWGLLFLDGLVGVLIGAYILYIAFVISRKPVQRMMGAPPPKSTIQRIKELSYNHPRIIDVHDIIYHSYGSSQIVSLHIGLENHLTLTEAHDIATQLSQTIRKELQLFVTVHMDPVEKKTELYHRIRDMLNRFCEINPTSLDFHGLNVINTEHRKKVSVDIHMHEQTDHQRSEKIIAEIKEMVQQAAPEIDTVDIRIDPLFTRH